MKRKIVGIAAAVVLAAALLGSTLYISSLRRDYPSAEKYTVAMGTILSQKLYGDTPGTAVNDIIGLVDSLEGIISFHDEDSALSSLNKEGSTDNPVLTGAIEQCLGVCEKSKGAFDITLGEISELWGFGTENQGIPEKEQLSGLLEDCGYERLNLEESKLTFDGKLSVDLGSVGKGLACDYIMSYLRQSEQLSGAVVSVGGSILAYGEHNKASEPWRIAIRHPRQENAYLGIIELEEGFVSTSGDYEKYFEKDGVRYHHILDGNTGYPCSSELISVTVVCQSGILSDALSTACLVLGEEKGRELLESYGASGVMVDKDMNIYTVGDIAFEKTK